MFLASWVRRQLEVYGLFSNVTLEVRKGSEPGLPDGLFSNQKSQFGKILECLAKENLGIFYDHFVYFTAIGKILWPFGIFCGHWVYFSPFWYFVPRNNWQPWSEPICTNIQR
jgi:hypothetical protein